MDGSRVLPQGHWQNCDKQALGAAGELIAAAQCALLGHQVYRPVADDRGIDLLIDLGAGRHIEVQVKAVRPPQGSYTFMPKKHFPLEPYRAVLLIVFPPDADQPSLFLIPAPAWANASSPLTSYKEEYGININAKWRDQLAPWEFRAQLAALTVG
ncbi:hypothetical protein [Streptomyces flaveus]|uniref:DUF4365 domain-containing protein n=1 Tax=Streptomyces flaveus TaxID=66370 RepID=A0A917REA1_9ACTN|nr:hypothetical protein [Streptomyces flaveus]GGL03444.1 hypothetical protein GCM10010094_75440 [Streptomyces flaveus]